MTALLCLAALWAIDYVLAAAKVGIEQVFFHDGIGFKYNLVRPRLRLFTFLRNKPNRFLDPACDSHTFHCMSDQSENVLKLTLSFHSLTRHLSLNLSHRMSNPNVRIQPPP